MKLITVHDAKDGRARTIRADLILELSEGEENGHPMTFILLDKIGWSRPVMETHVEIKHLIANAPDLGGDR